MLISFWQRNDLKQYGDIVLEDVFRVVYSKSGTVRNSASAFKSNKEVYVFLFEKVLLITKKKDEGYNYKHHVEVSSVKFHVTVLLVDHEF